MTLDLIDALFILIAFQFAFIGIVLLGSKSPVSYSNSILGIFFCLWCMNILDGLLLINGFYLKYPAWGLWEDPFIFLYGPLIYFYTRSLLEKDFVLSGSKWLHFLPFLAIYGLLTFAYHLQPAAEKLKILSGYGSFQLPDYASIGVFISNLHVIGYFIAAFYRLYRHEQFMKQQFSSREKVALKWIRFTLTMLLIIILLSFFNTLALFTPLREYYELLLILISLVVVYFIVGVMTRMIRQPGLFQTASVDNAKNQQLSLSEEETEKISKRLRDHMNTEEPFLNSELSLTNLAGQIGVTERNLSEVINGVFNTNFYDFINHYRIEKAKELLVKPPDPKMSIQQIMYEVGFNSKSSFNTEFKKRTGTTPSAFKAPFAV